MSNVLERAKAHYRSLQEQFIDVPEWGENGEPLRVYFKRPSIREIQQLRSAGKEDDVGIRMVVTFCKDGPGDDAKPLFDKMAVGEIARAVDPNVITRLVNAILPSADIKEMEKN